MRLLDRIMDLIRKNRSQITMAGAAGGAVLVVYTIFNLIVFNTVSIGYALAYALVAFVLYFIVMRLIKYVMPKKEGVIEKKT